MVSTLFTQQDNRKAEAPFKAAPFTILLPKKQTSPVVYASPHSGNLYPESFLAQADLDPVSLRKSEDAFVDELYESCVEKGSPFLKANYPRAFVDLNREPYELDPMMFDAPLPSYVNTDSPRAKAGLGTIAKIVTSGFYIYRGKLKFEEVRDRVEHLYHPYHAKLRELIENTRLQFGGCLLVDCHSMPSVTDINRARGKKLPCDIVLGDRYGTSCAPWITDLAEESLIKEGFKVRRNTPYAGGYTTEHYSAPDQKVHTLQIEINRDLYMDEEHITRLDSLHTVKHRLNHLIESLNTIDASKL